MSTEKKEAGLQAPNLNELLVNKWSVSSYLGAALDQNSINLIEQTLLEYEVALKNMAYFGLVGNEKAFFQMKDELDNIRVHREHLLINVFKRQLQLKLAERQKILDEEKSNKQEKNDIVEDINQGGQLQGTTSDVTL